MSKQWRDVVNWERIPVNMREGMCKYFEEGIRPGDFLYSVLTNDLRAAAFHADNVNRHLLYDYVMWLTSFAPYGSWGSEQHVTTWIRNKGINAARQEQENGQGSSLEG